jgi:hypothetical protein
LFSQWLTPQTLQTKNTPDATKQTFVFAKTVIENVSATVGPVRMAAIPKNAELQTAAEPDPTAIAV